MHILGRIKELESFPRLAHGIGAVDERRIKSELARGKAVSSEFPLLSREGRGIAHPAAGEIKLLSIGIFPLTGSKCKICMWRANEGDMGLIPGEFKAHQIRHWIAGSFKHMVIT